MKSFWDHQRFSTKVKLVETLNNWVAEVQTKNKVVRAVIKGHEVCNSVELTWRYRWSKLKANRDTINFYEILQVDLYLLQQELQTGFANFIDEWSQCDFCFTNFGVILEYLESSIRLPSTWSWHVYTIVRDTRNSWGVRWPGKLKSMKAVIQ